MNRLIVIDHVSKWYGQIEAVSGITFEAAQGEFVSLLGPSGCGKTTTLRMIAGLETPSEGRILLSGRDVTTTPAFQRNTPMVWQSFALIPHLTVVQNVEFGLKMRGLSTKERRRQAMAMLESVGLQTLAGRPADALSSGQKQRVGLARALVLRPPLLLLDEPLAALDANLRVHMQSELRRVQRESGITFLFVTHSQSEALSMSDRVIVMNQGRLEQIDPPETIYRRPKTRFVAEFVGKNNIITGCVAERNGRLVTIASSAGDVHVETVGNTTALTGGGALVVVPADRVELLRPGESKSDHPENRLAAVYTGLEFHGSLITFFFRLRDDTIFRVEKHGTGLSTWGLRPGDEYLLSWEPADGYLLAP